MAESFFTDIKSPQQKTYDNLVLPKILSPKSKNQESVLSLIEAIKDQKPWLESLLYQHGALLFRGFPVATPADFNDVIEVFGYEEFPYVGGNAPRIHVVGRVYTANEAPHDKKIHFHHEMVQVSEYPSKLFFFCEVEPSAGGETPIALSHVVYERIKKKYPDFVQKLEESGVIYTRVLGEEDDYSSPIGRSWKSTFSTTDKSVAEERASNLGMKLEWTQDGVKMIRGPIPGITFNETRQRKIFFNNVMSSHTGCKEGRNDPKNAITFGDGKPLPDYIVDDCAKIIDEESASLPWQKGDVLLIDNLAVLHARRPFTPPRRILASLCK